jgi:hypothetical protein
MSSTTIADVDTDDQRKRLPVPHPLHPLSKTTERRLLRGMLERAEQGDAASAEALIRLAREARQRPDR